MCCCFGKDKNHGAVWDTRRGQDLIGRGTLETLAKGRDGQEGNTREVAGIRGEGTGWGMRGILGRYTTGKPLRQPTLQGPSPGPGSKSMGGSNSAWAHSGETTECPTAFCFNYEISECMNEIRRGSTECICKRNKCTKCMRLLNEVNLVHLHPS